MQPQKVKLIDGGKLVIPAAMRRELGIGSGDTVMVHVDEGELRVRTLNKALERARSIIRKHIPADRSLVDELIADRRAEADGE